MNEICDIHNPFIVWLNERGIPFHRNRPDKPTTAIKGDPDFLLTWCSYCVYIECKVPREWIIKRSETAHYLSQKRREQGRNRLQPPGMRRSCQGHLVPVWS